jgi:hypothetical protein
MTNQGTDLADPTSHPQVLVRWRGLEADVDEELAPLIRALWRVGIHTCNAGSPGSAGRSP